MSSLSYQERVTITVEEQLKRAEANALFRDGDLPGAIVAYEAALETAKLDENKLPLLSNLGFCHLKLAAPEAGTNFKVPSELRAASQRLLSALALGGACFRTPVLGAKVAGRQLEACRRAGDSAGERVAAAECRFYISVCLEKGLTPPTLDLPAAPPAEAVTFLLMAIGSCEETDDIATITTALAKASGEALDEHRMNALCLAVHISCLRPAKLATRLLEAVLESGTPPDARHEQGRTALMLAANNGRLDLCKLLLDAGASASATDSEGCTP